MAAISHETRAAIRRLYFADRRSIDAIAAELRLTERTVRRALVLPGGASSQPPAGPYQKERDA